jgi:hypothetical protein
MLRKGGWREEINSRTVRSTPRALATMIAIGTIGIYIHEAVTKSNVEWTPTGPLSWRWIQNSTQSSSRAIWIVDKIGILRVRIAALFIHLTAVLKTIVLGEVQITPLARP